ncbi:MAG TPA: DUF4418 family protein [Methanoregula sp.]|nr:DUF4418 family protein [Methanoregula sp.]
MKIYWPSIVLIILGILLAIAPWTFAPVCEVDGLYAKLANGKEIPMPCGWTARAEIGLGALLAVAGILLAIAKSNETRRIIGIFGIAIGVLVILFPTYITKMCALADHPCNLLTKPVLIILGVAAIIIAAYVSYSARAD